MFNGNLRLNITWSGLATWHCELLGVGPGEWCASVLIAGSVFPPDDFWTYFLPVLSLARRFRLFSMIPVVVGDSKLSKPSWKKKKYVQSFTFYRQGHLTGLSKYCLRDGSKTSTEDSTWHIHTPLVWYIVWRKLRVTSVNKGSGQGRLAKIAKNRRGVLVSRDPKIQNF